MPTCEDNECVVGSASPATVYVGLKKLEQSYLMNTDWNFQ